MALRRRSLARFLILLFTVVLLVYYVIQHITRTWRPVLAQKRGNQINYIKPADHQAGKEREFTIEKQFDDEEIRISINQKYCGRDRCRFLLPITIAEQESKAQEHFRHIAFLSGSLDRTIVLPNVYNSHLGACRKLPFSFYYDHAWLDQNKSYFNYITMEEFKAWVEEMRLTGLVPSAQEIFLEVNRSWILDKTGNCFSDQFDFTDRRRKRFILKDPAVVEKRKGNYTRILFDVLSDKTLQKEYVKNLQKAGHTLKKIPSLDVIHLFYDRRAGFIENPDAWQLLNYNKQWLELADKIATQLKPYVAVHWRMERVEPLSVLQSCAENLVEKINTIGEKSGIKPNIFLLTDYPHLLNTSKASPESASFKQDEIKKEHHDAIKYLYDHLNITVAIVNRSKVPIPFDELPASNWNILQIPTFSSPVDPKVLGIIDKLVAVRAQWFVAGRPEVCAKLSSYTRQIKQVRTEVYKAGDPSIWGQYDEFG